MKTYSEKLKDPRWQKKRLEIMSDANFQCQTCGDNEKTLNVHHIIYRKGADPWDYPSTLFKCLCQDCHSKWHDERYEFNENIGCIESESLGIEEIFWLADGIVFGRIPALEAVELSVKHRIKALRSNKK